MEVTLKHLLVQDAYLMIGFLVFQPSQCLGLGNDARKIETNRVEHLVVGHTALYRIVLLLPWRHMAT